MNWYWWNQMQYTWGCAWRKTIQVWKMSREITICVRLSWLAVLVCTDCTWVYHVNGLFVLCEWHKYQQFENMIVKQRGKCHNFLTKLSFQVAARNVWHVLKNGLKQSSTLTASKRGNVSINLFPKSALQADFKPIKAI